MSIREISPIETFYHGHLFRSRLEARWAVYFDALGVEWYYEHEGYELANGQRWLPDFLLADVGLRSTDGSNLLVEVKGTRELAEEAALSLEPFVKSLGLDIALLYGNVGYHPKYEDPTDPQVYQKQLGYAEEADGEKHAGDDTDMHFFVCRGCDAVKFDFLESFNERCELCGEVCDIENPQQVAAAEEARSSRFEFGGYREV